MPAIQEPGPPPQTEMPSGIRMGRIRSDDPRDHNYRIGDILRRLQEAAPVAYRNYRYFLPASGPRRWRDQGNVSSCTEHALTHRLTGWPLPRTLESLPWQQHELYHLAQGMDEWAGGEQPPAKGPNDPYYEGTSGRAICRAARGLGVLAEWWNAFTVREVYDLLLQDTADYTRCGPVLVGTDWDESMFVPDAEGFIRPNGRAVGGHMYLCIGAHRPKGIFYFLNSWTSMKHFKMREADFMTLLEQRGGEAEFPVEVPWVR